GEQWSAHKTVVAVPFHNAAMAVISLSNVRFADWVQRHAAVTLAFRGNYIGLYGDLQLFWRKIFII
ncbi:MAG: hypothetical protein II118_04275, partial [Ruminococcus sp.]|nr:hypothetical protein [Ruminococcus sp.]